MKYEDVFEISEKAYIGYMWIPENYDTVVNWYTEKYWILIYLCLIKNIYWKWCRCYDIWVHSY